MKDFSKFYAITLKNSKDEDVDYVCEIINYNTTTSLYTISVRGLGDVKMDVEEDKLKDFDSISSNNENASNTLSISPQVLSIPRTLNTTQNIPLQDDVEDVDDYPIED